MSNEPDLELALRGRPIDLPTVKVALAPPPPPRRRPSLVRRVSVILRRRLILLAAFAALGAIAGFVVDLLRTPEGLARVQLEVNSPADADAIAARLLSANLSEAPARESRIAALAEYNSTRGTPAFIEDVERRLKSSISTTGRILTIEFRSSSPSRSTAFLDLLATQIVQDRQSAQQERMDSQRKRLSTALDDAAAQLKRAEADLEKGDISSADDRAHDSPSAVVESRWKEYAQRRATYDEIARRISSLSLDAAERTARPLGPARVVEEPKSPNPVLYTLLGGLIFFLAGCPLCVAIDTLSRRIRHTSQVPDALGLPILGAVPRIGRDEDASSQKVSDAIQSVLASLWIAGQNQRRARVISFTSPTAAAGKTGLTMDIAVALANTRRRVILIDADLRQPTLHTLFGAPEGCWGLANLLEQDTPVEDYNFDDLAFRSNVAGLYVLPAGSGPQSISDLTQIERMSELLLRFRLEFHAVLINTPASLDYPDTRVISRLADAAVVVIRENHSSLDDAQELVQALQDDGVSVLGAVVTGAKKK